MVKSLNTNDKKQYLMNEKKGEKGILFTITAISFMVILVLIVMIMTRPGHYSNTQQGVDSRAKTMTALAKSIDEDLERAVYITGYRAILGLHDMVRNASSYNNQPEFIPYNQTQWYVRRIMVMGVIPIIDKNGGTSPPLAKKINFVGVWSGIPEQSKYVIVYRNMSHLGTLKLVTGHYSEAMNESNKRTNLQSYLDTIKKKTQLSGVEISLSIHRVSRADPNITVVSETNSIIVPPVSPELSSIKSVEYLNAVFPYNVTMRLREYRLIEFTIYYDLNITDAKANTSIIIKGKKLKTILPLTELPDPMYTGFSAGKMQNQVYRFEKDGDYIYKDLVSCTSGHCNSTDLKLYLNGPEGHSYYRPYGIAPSYLERFEGRLKPTSDEMLNYNGQLGIESIVNTRTVVLSGLTPLKKVSLDYVYFNRWATEGRERVPDADKCPIPINPVTATQCAIDSVPSSFAINKSLVFVDNSTLENETAWVKFDCCALRRFGMLDAGENVTFFRLFTNATRPFNNPAYMAERRVLSVSDINNIMVVQCKNATTPCPAPPTPPKGHAESYQCSDGFDNEGDGKADRSDPGCYDEFRGYSAYDDNESDSLPACRNFFDDDHDGEVDMDDPSCQYPNYYSELPQCSDNLDNDGDGKRDYNGGFGGGISTPPITSSSPTVNPLGSPTPPPTIPPGTPDPECFCPTFWNQNWNNESACCGNNIIEPGEDCDPPGVNGCGAPCRKRCPNGKVEWWEACDGTNFTGKTCASFNINKPYGYLECKDICMTIDRSHCSAIPVTTGPPPTTPPPPTSVITPSSTPPPTTDSGPID
jgi:hypothetical protein